MGLVLLFALIASLPGCMQIGRLQAVLSVMPTEGPAPLAVEFDLSRTVTSGEDVSFLLEFGDGTPIVRGEDVALKIPHVYAAVGTFVARLLTIGSDGRTDRDELTVVVKSGIPREGSGVGDMAFDFTAATTDGSEVTLSDLRGDVVLIEFWGSWCKPCKQSMPHVYGLWEQFNEAGFVVLAVSTDEAPEDPIRFLRDNGFEDLICIWEPGGKQTRIKVMYGVAWVPRSIVVDRAGIVRYNGHPMDLGASVIAGLLAEATPSASEADGTDAAPGKQYP